MASIEPYHHGKDTREIADTATTRTKPNHKPTKKHPMTPIVQSNPNMECRNSNGTRAPVQETQTKIGKLKTNCQITSTHPPNQTDEQLHIITKTHHSALKPPNCRGRVH
eukprot:1016213_1